MISSCRWSTSTDQARRDFETHPVALAAVANGMSVERYRKLLLELYQIVWHFNPICAAAASRMPDTHRELRYFLYRHMDGGVGSRAVGRQRSGGDRRRPSRAAAASAVAVHAGADRLQLLVGRPARSLLGARHDVRPRGDRLGVRRRVRLGRCASRCCSSAIAASRSSALTPPWTRSTWCSCARFSSRSRMTKRTRSDRRIGARQLRIRHPDLRGDMNVPDAAERAAGAAGASVPVPPARMDLRAVAAAGANLRDADPVLQPRRHRRDAARARRHLAEPRPRAPPRRVLGRHRSLQLRWRPVAVQPAGPGTGRRVVAPLRTQVHRHGVVAGNRATARGAHHGPGPGRHPRWRTRVGDAVPQGDLRAQRAGRLSRGAVQPVSRAWAPGTTRSARPASPSRTTWCFPASSTPPSSSTGEVSSTWSSTTARRGGARPCRPLDRSAPARHARRAARRSAWPRRSPTSRWPTTVDLWAQAALSLTTRDLRLMERLARAQVRKAGARDEGAVARDQAHRARHRLGRGANGHHRVDDPQLRA